MAGVLSLATSSNYLVEVSRYAYLKVEDFAELDRLIRLHCRQATFCHDICWCICAAVAPKSAGRARILMRDRKPVWQG